ncbi:MAG: diphosphomevalonate decarboxylase [Thermoanaerobaculales bacterium]|jgi:diphosphomevalonate decarboxylase|nr:diphosphomevalonate decarboxylase [Thermoanaerobaculales bacterium]
MEAVAVAHPNIALVKYWGKADPSRNLPAVGSISITLDTLTTTTRVRFGRELDGDILTLDGEPASAERSDRVSACLDLLRERRPGLGHAEVVSRNSFPTAAGLASSASAFAALVTAVNPLLEPPLGDAELAEIARRCSGSAPRSLLGGFVELALEGDGTVLRRLLDRREWPLEVVIAVVSRDAKPVGSTAGMELTRTTSPYYEAWLATSTTDLAAARWAIAARDIEALAAVAEGSCLAMHAVAMAARPGLVYWGAPTVDGLHLVRELRRRGTPVFFTIDAGPQLKAVCGPGSSDAVAAALAGVPGVVEVVRCGLGEGARVVGR